jgi:hypothetical protein
VQDTDVEAVAGRPGEVTREVLGGLGRRVADPLDGGYATPLSGDVDDGCMVAREDGHRVRPRADGRPATDHRVVVAVHHKGRDSRIGQSCQSLSEADLGAKSADRAVVDVAGDQQERGVALEGEVDDRVKRIQRGLA